MITVPRDDAKAFSPRWRVWVLHTGIAVAAFSLAWFMRGFMEGAVIHWGTATTTASATATRSAVSATPAQSYGTAMDSEYFPAQFQNQAKSDVPEAHIQAF